VTLDALCRLLAGTLRELVRRAVREALAEERKRAKKPRRKR
jgi:hypothetical protein